ncbi:DUF6311 domain-containing protein [Roseococcus sp. YIM B11640]|uniref:DUF6311 domain-containing protein n=1 Tax=Roseococcus sp. YIM B11640 TaxID=3133973 RepID=UPI003C7EB2FF
MSRLAYPISCAFGAILSIHLFGLDFIWPRNGLDWRPVGDAAQHAIAQRHFLADAWRWPPLTVGTLQNVNLAFLDGIPALALPLKVARSWLPEGFHGIGLFYAIAWILQPVAAVWALRGAGVRGLGSGVAVALMASAMPAFIMRFGHAALCGHFVVLFSLGLYFRLVRDGRWWCLAVPWQAVALLIHPYLALMSLALLGAVPLTLLLRGKRFVAAGLGAAGAAAAMLGTMIAFDYLGAAGDGGYGQYALNLLSPFWPFRSLLLGGSIPREIDATGHGGWEGYNWLGLGLWAALAAGLIVARDRVLPGLRAHLGLVLALLGLTALAVSFRIGLGGQVVLDLGPAPGFLEQFRASGRFFWPVGYALMIGAAVLLAGRGAKGVTILIACGLLQFVDAAPMRAALSAWAHERQPWSVEAGALRPLFREAREVTFLPSWPCIPHEDGPSRVRALELLLLASETPRPVNSMYAARWREPPRCTDAEAMSRPLAPGELRVGLPQAGLEGSGCRALGDLTVCR